MTITETCSCSAVFAVEVSQSASNAGWAMEQIKDWRANHRHETSPNRDDVGISDYPDIPTIVESVSSHERALPFGFTVEPEGGWEDISARR